MCSFDTESSLNIIFSSMLLGEMRFKAPIYGLRGTFMTLRYIGTLNTGAVII